MANDVLDPSALISALPTLLPINKKRIETPYDAVSALLHTALIALGFRLIAVDDTSPAVVNLSGAFPDAWNLHGPGHYTFRYRHEQSSLEFVIKIAKLGSRTLVNAIAVESDKAATLDISTADFVSSSFFPYDVSASDAQPLVHGFISSNRVADLISQFKLKIISKLVPGLRKEGYTEESGESSSTGANAPPARPAPMTPPFAPERPFNLPFPAHPDNPLEIGRRDLDPFPDNPFAPPSLFPPRGGGNGMYVGRDHPIFGIGRQGNGGTPTRGPWGGNGYLPPMGAPPGARFDPVGPGRGPLPGRGGPNPRGGPPGGVSQREPDNDEFMPPGAFTASCEVHENNAIEAEMGRQFCTQSQSQNSGVAAELEYKLRLCHQSNRPVQLPLPSLSMSASPSNNMPPTSPIRPRRNAPIPGFRVPPRPKPRPIEEMTVRELRDLYEKNNRVLSRPAPSTSTYVPRIQAEQSRIEAQLVELEGVDGIQRALRQTTIKTEEEMNVDVPSEPREPRIIEAKQRALNKFALAVSQGPHVASGFSLQEAIQLEQQAHALDRERKQRILERKRRMGLPIDGEILTRQEREARIWAFMSYKPTESDLEDDDDDDDPANWFEDDQDDGRKGQDIVEPDPEDLMEIIRVDPKKIHYSTFYEPHDGGD
ncbi:hypothetical protein EW146_g6926 [Bondarzewia mesenterica]|uniref:Uncharacterized protein n=1 Tax=Bondarzewia mesenterica TaxID=1095465 RepID=A0A4S4LM64_9AGAM|nr:hypothetical protein EW146_g6926 [Bondarzewia mesenterica]